MATLDFPVDPVIGQTYQFGAITYTWDGEKWKAFGGSGGGGTYVTTVGSISALREITGLSAFVGNKINVLGYYADTVGVGGGEFIITDDTTATDNGGTVIVTTDGMRLKRPRKSRLYASEFGAKGDWDGTTGTDNKQAIERMIATSNSSQPWVIDLDNVGVSSVVINNKNNWVGIISGSVFNISAKPTAAATNAKDTAGGALPTFKIISCSGWKLKGGFVDNRYREAFWVQSCYNFVNECDVIGSNINDNLLPNYYRFCGNFKLRKFRHTATSRKPSTGYYDWCNNLHFWDCGNFHIYDFTVSDCGSNGIYIGSNCRDYSIGKFLITNNAMSGIQIAWSTFGAFPYRGVISDGLINGNRADGIDVNNTSGNVVDRIDLSIVNVISVNNGYNTDGSVTVDGSGLGTFTHVSHFSVDNCSTIDPARTGFYAYACSNFSVTNSHIKKEKTSNNYGGGISLENCKFYNFSAVNVAMAPGTECIKLYGEQANGTIGTGTQLTGGLVTIMQPSEYTTYLNVAFDGVAINTTQEVQGYVPFRNCRILSTANGLRAFASVDNCAIKSSGGIGLVYGGDCVDVRGGTYQGTSSGTYCQYSNCSLSNTDCIGGNGPAAHFIGTTASQIIGNRFTAGTGNTLLTDSGCTKTIKFGNKSVGIEALGGTFDINY